MTGRSIFRAATRTRVVIRSAGIAADAEGTALEVIGGSEMSGLGVATAATGEGRRGLGLDGVGGDRVRVRQQATGQQHDAERGENGGHDPRAEPVEDGHRSGIVAAVSPNCRRPLVLVRSGPYEGSPVDRRRPRGRDRRRRAGARGARRADPRSDGAVDTCPCEHTDRRSVRRRVGRAQRLTRAERVAAGRVGQPAGTRRPPRGPVRPGGATVPRGLDAGRRPRRFGPDVMAAGPKTILRGVDVTP